MDTSRSDSIVSRYRGRDFVAGRKVQTYERDFAASPGELFPLLCPTLEADWIPGWTCDLVFTTTGYAEPDCVFTTGEDNPLAAGTWAIYEHEPERSLGVIMTSKEMVLNLQVAVSRRRDGGTHGRWTLTTTALTPETNERVAAMPDGDPRFQALLDGLDHYLTTGRMRAA